VTTGGFEIVPSGDMTIDYGARRVLDTAGNFVVGLPSSSDYVATITPSWPDLTKNRAYNWTWETVYNGANNYALGNRGDAWIDAPPQEWSATTILAAVPAGCNLFAAKVRLSRTTAPTKTFNGQTIGVKPDQNVWIPYTGSILVEAQLNFARAFSLYIDSGNLILHRQQSLGKPPGGWGQYGASAPGVGTTSKGGIWWDLDPTGGFYGAIYDGWLVYNDPATMSGSSSSSQTVITGNPPNQPQDRNIGNVNALPTTDTTNYFSGYSLDIAGKFCRAY
jgi:hypothetical protein